MTPAQDAVHLLAGEGGGARDLGEITRAHVADLELLHVLDRNVAFVHHGVAQLAERRLHAGDPDGGRPHVHPPAAGAEVHGHAEDVDDHESGRVNGAVRRGVWLGMGRI